MGAVTASSQGGCVTDEMMRTEVSARTGAVSAWLIADRWVLSTKGQARTRGCSPVRVRASELSGLGTDRVTITFHLSRRSSVVGRRLGRGAELGQYFTWPSAMPVCGLSTALSPGPDMEPKAPPHADWLEPDHLPGGPAPLTPLASRSSRQSLCATIWLQAPEDCQESPSRVPPCHPPEGQRGV